MAGTELSHDALGKAIAALEAMLRRADARLYSAKAQGRSRTLEAGELRLQAA